MRNRSPISDRSPSFFLPGRNRIASAGAPAVLDANATSDRTFSGAVALTAIGLMLRVFHLSHQSLWTDEILTPLSSNGSLWRVVTQKEINTNIPPLYYVIAHFFLPLGNKEWVLRLPSVLFGSASIPLFFLVVREWLGSRVALACAAMLTISPFHVWYSQESRPYALFLFLALLALRLLQLVLKDPGNRWKQIAFVLATASVFYCHTLGLPFIVLLAAYAVLLTPPLTRRRWIPIFGAIAVLLIPAVYRLVTFAPTASADSTRALGIAFVPYAFWAFATGYSLGPTLTQLHSPSRTAITLDYLPVILPIGVFVSTMTVIGAVELWKLSRETFWRIALWLAFPLGFALAGTVFTRHPFNVRYIVLALPAFLIALAIGTVTVRRGIVRVLAMAGLVLVSMLSLSNYYFVTRYAREDNRGAGAFLAANAQPGDFVLADAPYTALNLQYYAQRSDVGIIGFPPLNAEPSRAATVLRASAVREPTRPDTVDLREMIGARSRFWVFLSRTYHGVPAANVLTYCDRHFRRSREFATDNDVLLILYDTPR